MTTRREYTAQEIEQVNQAEKELRAKGLDEPAQRLGALTDEYFQANKGIPVTVAAVAKLIESQPGLRWISLAQVEYLKVAIKSLIERTY